MLITRIPYQTAMRRQAVHLDRLVQGVLVGRRRHTPRERLRSIGGLPSYRGLQEIMPTISPKCSPDDAIASDGMAGVHVRRRVEKGETAPLTHDAR